MTNNTEHNLIVRFDDQSPSFVHGFEAGQVWEQIEKKRSIINRTVHAINEDLFRRMARDHGYSISVEVHQEAPEWAELELTRKREV